MKTERIETESCSRVMLQGPPDPIKCKEAKGVRNFDCNHYDACLNKAARSMWSGFSCEVCVHYR